MKFPRLPAQEIIKAYSDGKSLHEIAQEFQSYPNKILRLLRKHGVEIRKKSEAQSLCLKRQRKQHPTAGKTRDEETKEKISAGLTNFWDNMPESEYNKVIQRSKDNWSKFSQKQKDEMVRRSTEANRIVAKEGSAVEKWVKLFLMEAGFLVEYHKKGLMGTNLEVDLFLPKIAVAIEINGPQHYIPDIWGEEKFKQQVSDDNSKTGILLSKGLVVLHIKYMRSKLTLSVKNKLKTEILKVLEKIKVKFPSEKNRFIQIEV